MKLTVQTKLLPSAEQADGLRRTLESANSAANRLSQLAWGAKEFRRFPLHRAFYHPIRSEFPLSAQIVCLLNAKVADAYKLDRKVQRVFRKHGSIAYDSRVLSLSLDQSTISIWTLGGRAKMPFACGERQRTLLSYPRGESDLIFRNGKWFLNITVEVPEEKEVEALDCIGVDLGLVNIAVDSDGNKYSGAKLNKIRHRNQALRRKLQRIGTKSARRLLKKRSRKEQRFATDTNHVISRRIVSLAKRTNRSIAIEDLSGIRSRIRARKRERTKLHGWAFAQLGTFLDYKATLAGVPLVRVDPRHTSQRCSKCGHTEKANRKSRDVFACRSCGNTSCADENGAANIRSKGLELADAGALNHPNAGAIADGQVHRCSSGKPCPSGEVVE